MECGRDVLLQAICWFLSADVAAGWSTECKQISSSRIKLLYRVGTGASVTRFLSKDYQLYLQHCTSAYDHITANAPDTIGTQKLNVVELAEVLWRGTHGGNASVVCFLLLPIFCLPFYFVSLLLWFFLHQAS